MAADLPLSARDRAWDAAAALQRVEKWASSDGTGHPATIDWQRFGRAFLYTDGSKTVDGHKLQIADVENGQLVAVWRAITAVAGVLQGARGGVDIPPASKTSVRSTVAGYYAKARGTFNDPAIKVPWTDMNQLIRKAAGL